MTRVHAGAERNIRSATAQRLSGQTYPALSYYSDPFSSAVFAAPQNKKAGAERSFLATRRLMNKELLPRLEVENQTCSERIVSRNRRADVRPDEISLRTPIQVPLAKLIVHSPAHDERVAGIATQRARLSEPEAFPTNHRVNPRLKTAGTVPSNVRPPTDEKRLRSLAGISPQMAESCDSSAFHAKPVIKISGDVPLEAKVVKFLAQDVEMQILESRSELPLIAIGCIKSRGSCRLGR
jgi:hypothetical protein